MDHSTHSHAAATTVDPVCGMTVDPAKNPHRLSHAQKTYHFCSAGCRGKFAADPDKYLHGAAPDPAADTKNTIYTCPMHPEIRQVGPGACPICGMALEPEAGGADDGGELADMTRRLWISTLLTLPVVALDMGGHFGLWHLPGHISAYAELVLATPVVLWGGWPFFVRGVQSLITRNLNMFTLIAMGTGVAYGYSIVAALAPGLFPAAFHDEHGGIALYFEAPASSPCWYCSARCSNCAPAPRLRARSARSSHSRPKPRGASRMTAAMKTWRWSRCGRRSAARSSRRKNSGRWRTGRRQIRGR